MNASSPTSTGPSAPLLRGRRTECDALDAAVGAARTGQSSVLVLHGEAGVGKTALLDYVVHQSTGFRVARARGVESERELAFAGLHQLCAPMVDLIGGLPGPQRDALTVAFGLAEGAPPDHFMVGLAALTLLSEVAENQPLVCLIDDAQWVDQASSQSLSFVARRLLAEPVLLVFAVREPHDVPELVGLPELRVTGVDDRAARQLLASAVRGRLDEQVRDRMLAESHGNPLALLELPRGLTPAELAGGFALPNALPLTTHLEQSFLRRVKSLPRETRLLLLVAAAEPVGDAGLLWRVAKQLGLSADAALPAEADGLVELGARVRFRHPLMRAAAYRAAPLRDCQKVHRALADAIDPERDPDRRAWHRAQATPAPDEDVAEELERSAGRAQARGGMAAAAAFLERSAALTLEPTRRAKRSLDAAEAKHLAGASDVALELLVATELGPLDEFQLARVDLMRGQIAFGSSNGRDAPLLLLKAAKKLQTLDVRLARETYLDALSAAIYVGRLAGEVGAVEVATAVRAAPPAPEPERAADLLLDGMAALITDGYGAGRPILDRALRAFVADGVSRVEGIRWLWLACRAAHDLWDDRTWEALCSSQLELARGVGALVLLPIPLTQRIGEHLLAGEFGAAASMIAELEIVSEATGNQLPPYGAAALAAWEGRADASQQIDACLHEVSLRGEGMGLSLTYYTKAVLHNGLCRYEDALAAAQLACDYPAEPGFYNWGLVELVEAASRSDQPRLASEALRRLSETTRGGETAWGQGIEARSRALVSDGSAADALYREAIERLAQCRISVHLGRAQLIYGEWLRRENRRSDARKQLRAAHAMFADIGAQPFAERARRELIATGERVRKRTVEARDDLTAQEAQIARLAGVGHTNPEIGAQLFISPKTVEWHLHKVFTKLEISSRRELRDTFPVATRAAITA